MLAASVAARLALACVFTTPNGFFLSFKYVFFLCARHLSHCLKLFLSGPCGVKSWKLLAPLWPWRWWHIIRRAPFALLFVLAALSAANLSSQHFYMYAQTAAKLTFTVSGQPVIQIIQGERDRLSGPGERGAWWAAHGHCGGGGVAGLSVKQILCKAVGLMVDCTAVHVMPQNFR